MRKGSGGGVVIMVVEGNPSPRGWGVGSGVVVMVAVVIRVGG